MPIGPTGSESRARYYYWKPERPQQETRNTNLRCMWLEGRMFIAPRGPEALGPGSRYYYWKPGRPTQILRNQTRQTAITITYGGLRAKRLKGQGELRCQVSLLFLLGARTTDPSRTQQENKRNNKKMTNSHIAYGGSRAKCL